MIARMQQGIAATLLALAVACAAWIVAGDHTVVAVALTFGLFTGHAIFLAIEFGWMHIANANDPSPRASIRNVIGAWLLESLHAPRVFLWRQPFGAERWPDLVTGQPDRGTPGQDARRGVLLVHGFMCNRGLWNRWLARLHANDTPVVAITMEPAFGSIDAYAALIEGGVRKLEDATGLAPVVIAHSMGGLALRRWWAAQADEARIHHAITIGTPHRGTRLARFAVSPNGRQMQENSAWLQELTTREAPGRAARMTCFYSHTDNIVFSASTATLAGAENRHLEASPHVAMVDHPAPWAELQRWIRT